MFRHEAVVRLSWQSQTNLTLLMTCENFSKVSSTIHLRWMCWCQQQDNPHCRQP